MSGRAATTSIIPGRYAISVGDASMPAPHGWCWTILSNVARLETGHTPSRSHPEYWEDGDIAWIGIKDARLHHGKRIFQTLQQVTQAGVDNSASRKLPAGTVCLSRTASVGYVLVMGREMATSQDFVNWVCSDALVPEFLMYALMAEGEDIRRFGKGTTHTTIYFPEVKAFHLCLPPVEEQRRIVTKIEELFSDLDAGMAALKRAKSNLKRYRASVLKAAVEGHLTAAWRAEHPNTEPAANLIKRVQTPPRPSRWSTRSKDIMPGHAALSVGKTDSELPRGWTWVQLAEIARMETGHTPSRRHPEWWEGEIPWIGIADAREHHGGNILETVQHTNQAGLDNSAARLLPEGTVCISRTASVGYVVVMGRPMSTSQDFVNWVPTACVTSDWLRIIFIADRDALLRFGKGSVHKTIYFPEWLSTCIALPPLEEQHQIVRIVDEKLTQITAAEREIHRGLVLAARLRQSILKQAFEGKLVAQDQNDEPVSALLARIQVPSARSLPEAAPTIRRPLRLPKEVFWRRASVVSYTVSKLASQPSFGRTQLEKTVHLAQCHLGIDLGFQFERYAAGPFDKDIYRLEAIAKKKEWFTTQRRPKYGVTYHPGTKISDMCQQACGYLGPKQADLDRLLNHIAKMNTDEAELFATAYAAWNDLLIDGRPADDDAIIAEVHGWHPEKAKFTAEMIRSRLKWMRTHGYIPAGQGQRTQVIAKETKLKSRRRKTK